MPRSPSDQNIFAVNANNLEESEVFYTKVLAAKVIVEDRSNGGTAAKRARVKRVDVEGRKSAGAYLRFAPKRPASRSPASYALDTLEEKDKAIQELEQTGTKSRIRDHADGKLLSLR